MLMAAVGASGDHQERRHGDRRKLEEKAVGASGSNPVLTERVKSDRASGSEEGQRGDRKQPWKLLVWDQDGNCHEGTTPYIGKPTMFVESTWMAPIGSDITISLVPGEEDSVGQELIQGKVIWHCPQDDEFKNEAGFGVLFQQQWPQLLGPDTLSGPKEGV
ncbi:MAG: hypothetical protein Nkreftii_002996 [Candidatus Nitrospira kreftii]|uniref:PilZ domain-containing protein n=1 Tax=Candidatus Nitrospira kreftii TaxID=2652173 RepID=A0A7S8IZJ1_9BACT|nr:MAG: hypothetical protein Nkreftii_002996 [Candidatus Nitrospira kreftii]